MVESELANPYKAPVALDVAGVSPRKGFRWRIIPAAFSGLMGGFMVLAATFTFASFAYHSRWGRIPIRLHFSDVAILALYETSGLLLIAASNFWYRGRWWAAAVSMAIGFTLPLILPYLNDLLFH